MCLRPSILCPGCRDHFFHEKRQHRRGLHPSGFAQLLLWAHMCTSSGCTGLMACCDNPCDLFTGAVGSSWIDICFQTTSCAVRTLKSCVTYVFVILQVLGSFISGDCSTAFKQCAGFQGCLLSTLHFIQHWKSFLYKRDLIKHLAITQFPILTYLSFSVFVSSLMRAPSNAMTHSSGVDSGSGLRLAVIAEPEVIWSPYSDFIFPACKFQNNFRSFSIVVLS